MGTETKTDYRASIRIIREIRGSFSSVGKADLMRISIRKSRKSRTIFRVFRGRVAVLPGNRSEALAGGRTGQYSIRINDQCRICFEWADKSPGPQNVEIVDYH